MKMKYPQLIAGALVGALMGATAPAYTSQTLSAQQIYNNMLLLASGLVGLAGMRRKLHRNWFITSVKRERRGASFSAFSVSSKVMT